MASISSSSVHGNGYIVWDDSCGPILFDCGMPLAKLLRGLDALGFSPDDIRAVFISHEHTDHIRALCLKQPFPERFSIPVYASPLFWRWYFSCGYSLDRGLVRTIQDGERVKAGGFVIGAFWKPHDSVDPLSFVVEGKDGRAALLTDLGHVPSRIISLLRGVEYLILESNHDVEMEKSSGRPYALVARVLGDYGHLSNVQAGAALSRIATKNTRKVILAHLSLDCNTPEKAIQSCSGALSGCGFAGELKVAPAGDPTIYC
ncbi:MAG: MBL fold metallo-hydrolase [Firmicutes bacterium]|nr:MBL fold metallo-hydrolase [Candidatus Fermentithermobacillaceae bacterium]